MKNPAKPQALPPLSRLQVLRSDGAIAHHFARLAREAEAARKLDPRDIPKAVPPKGKIHIIR